MSRMVYVSRDNYERVFTAQQHSYTTSAQDVFKLSHAIRSMKERTRTMFEEGGIQNFNSVISLVRHVFEFEGAEQLTFHNLNFTHTPIAGHLDRAGFAGCGDFTDQCWNGYFDVTPEW